MSIEISFQGAKGAYTHQAIEKFSKSKNISYLLDMQKNFRGVFDKVNSSKCVGMIPIENSIGGSVVENYDLFFEFQDIEIIAELYLDIKHCLIGTKNSRFKDINTIISHPQALLQCRDFIQDIDADTKQGLDTAGSLFLLNENNPQTAVIASEFAANLYDLKILKRNIQDRNDNTTRFLLIKNRNNKFDFEKSLSKPTKTSLLFETKNIPAALYKTLGGFATNGVNLSKIESRPKKWGKKFQPIFFLACDEPLYSNNMKLALEELNYFSEYKRVLGTYTKEA